jgi:hypothetical protein
MNKEDAIKIYKKTYPTLPYDGINETKSFFVFYRNDATFVDPVMVRKSNGECRGYIPPVDGE